MRRTLSAVMLSGVSCVYRQSGHVCNQAITVWLLVDAAVALPCATHASDVCYKRNMYHGVHFVDIRFNLPRISLKPADSCIDVYYALTSWDTAVYTHSCIIYLE